MRFSLALPLAFALGAVAAPVDDCESLKSLSKLNGAKVFCSQVHPAAPGTPSNVESPKSHAKRFKEDDDRVVRLLSKLPESRQKAFCACYPAVATGTVSVSASVSATPSASASAVASAVASVVSSAADAALTPSAVVSSVAVPSVVQSIVASATATIEE